MIQKKLIEFIPQFVFNFTFPFIKKEYYKIKHDPETKKCNSGKVQIFVSSLCKVKKCILDVW